MRHHFRAIYPEPAALQTPEVEPDFDDWLRRRVALTRAVLAERAREVAARLGLSGFRSAHEEKLPARIH